MNNIAVFTCCKLSYECSGYRCFNAFNKRKEGFIKCSGSTQLYGFMHCNGCDCQESPEFNLKLKQLKKCNVEDIYISECVLTECSHIDSIIRLLTESFRVHMGTHGEG